MGIANRFRRAQEMRYKVGQTVWLKNPFDSVNDPVAFQMQVIRARDGDYTVQFSHPENDDFLAVIEADDELITDHEPVFSNGDRVNIEGESWKVEGYRHYDSQKGDWVVMLNSLQDGSSAEGYQSFIAAGDPQQSPELVGEEDIITE